MLVGMLVVAAVVSAGCSLADLPKYGWPESASRQGERMQELWSGTFTAALAVGALVWGLMFWCFIVYRKRRDSPLYPKQTRENLPVEMVYTALPFVAITILFFFGYAAQVDVLHLDEDPDVTVDVTAFKWNWDFQYLDVDGQPVTANDGSQIHTIGTADEIAVLVLPNESIVEYVLSSRDVVHSFWVPAFDYKLDVFPHPEANNSDNRFQTDLEREGAWVGHCAELCGTYHSAMNFEVRSVARPIFDAYLDGRKDGLNMADALARAGTEFPECGELCSPAATTTAPLVTDRQDPSPATLIAEGAVG